MKIYILMFLLVSILHANEVVDSLRRQLSQITDSMPGDSASLVKNLSGYAVTDLNTCLIQDFSREILKFNFPQEVIRAFTSIVYAYSVSFSTFHTTIVHSTYSHSEFIGTARNVNGVITLGFIQATAFGESAVQLPNCDQVESKDKGRCSALRIRIEQENVLTQEKIRKIELILRAFASQVANEKLNNPPQQFNQYQEQFQQYQKQLIIQKYSNQDCKLAATNCPFTIANNCFYYSCPSNLAQEKGGCSKYQQAYNNRCNAYFAQYDRNNDCQKCFCINHQIQARKNVYECL